MHGATCTFWVDLTPVSPQRRHLFRLWLSPPGDRPLPYCFAERFGSVTVGERGGILCPGTVFSVTLDSVAPIAQ
jgi:hypothetical protein